MRPLTVLLGILLGTSISITFSLGVVTLISAMLAGSHPELSGEVPQLLATLLAFLVLTAVSAASFVGQLRGRSWRLTAHLATAVVMAGLVTWFLQSGR